MRLCALVSSQTLRLLRAVDVVTVPSRTYHSRVTPTMAGVFALQYLRMLTLARRAHVAVL